MTELVGRPVRVTLEGTARPATKRRVEVLWSGGVLLVDPKADDIVVENLDVVRAWSKGDVIVHAEAGWTLTRTQTNAWVLSHDGSTTWTDLDVDEALTVAPYDRLLQVLRYQAGGV